jgi:alkylhydroperoxidase AhpD family core domain
MSCNPKEIAEGTMAGFAEMGKTNGKQLNAFNNFMGSVFKPDKLDVKTKELLSIGIALYARCQFCIVGHVKGALEAGATREEIMEAAMVAITFGGGPTATYVANYVVDALNEFENK